jgi:hypothetical protein
MPISSDNNFIKAMIVQLKKHESDADYAYLDNRGNLTAGIGHNFGTPLIAEKEFKKLNWTVTPFGSNRRHATKDEINSAFHYLSSEYLSKKASRNFNFLSTQYINEKNQIRLTPETAHLLVVKDISNATKKLENQIGKENFDKLSANQKIVFTDIVFNGVDLSKFSELKVELNKIHPDPVILAQESLITSDIDASGKKQRNWPRIINNFRLISSKSRDETIRDLAAYFEDKQSQEATIPQEIKDAIKKLPPGPSSSNDATDCQGRVNVLGYTRGDGIAVSNYSRSCPG